MQIRFPALVLLLVFSSGALAQLVDIDIDVTPKAASNWQVHYSIEPQVDALVFIRSFVDYRSSTWQPHDADFIVERFGNTDRIRRRDGKPFGQFLATIEPLIDKPAVGYSPFIRFSDGSMAVFTGQFAVGIPVSDNPQHYSQGIANGNAIAASSQSITIKPGIFERMIADASPADRYHKNQLSEGVYVYLGETEVKETDRLVTITDPATPKWLGDYLHNAMAATYDYYSYRLGSLGNEKPFLITALRQRDDRYVQASGGVLDNQVVMDIGLNLELDDTDSLRTFFVRFFAHESAHLWHRGGRIPAGGAGSWVHEGSADALAWLALEELGLYTAENTREMFEAAANDCADHLAIGVISDASRRDAHQAHYDCGAVIALSTHGLMQQHGRDLFDFWRQLLNAGTGPDDFRLDYYYFELSRVSPGFENELLSFVETSHDDSDGAVIGLLQRSGIDAVVNDDGAIVIPALP